MPHARNGRKPELIVVQGGKITARDFIRLSLAEKLSLVRNMPAKTGLAMIEADPEGEILVRALAPQELYWMLKETGETDAQTLVELSSPEQCEFFLDMELWKKSSLSQAKALEWLAYLLEAGETRVAEQLPHLDLETLIIIFVREITVGGGAGELLADEERTADWDHSFDNLYFITFRNPKHARLIGSFIEVIYRHDTFLYTRLMEEAKYELESEMEELAYSFRTGRLADLGFPEREEALAIYARLDPAAFVPAMDKSLLPVAEPVKGDGDVLARDQHARRHHLGGGKARLAEVLLQG